MAAQAQTKLILHADDLGMSHSINVASFELLDNGSISSASIMMPCPWVKEAAAYARKHPEKDLGLHLTLTSEWNTLKWGPVASRDKVPGLLDPEGYLWKSVEEVAMHASAAEVETELRAQIALARKMGIRFTHLDTHMGTLYARKDYFQVFEKMGREAGVPILRVDPKSEEVQGRVPHDLADYLTVNDALIHQQGYFLLTSLISPDPGKKAKTQEDRRQAYYESLRKLKPGVHQLILHLAVLDSELRAFTGSAENRNGDYRIFGDPATRKLLHDHNIQLVGWRNVATK